MSEIWETMYCKNSFYAKNLLLLLVVSTAKKMFGPLHMTAYYVIVPEQSPILQYFYTHLNELICFFLFCATNLFFL